MTTVYNIDFSRDFIWVETRLLLIILTDKKISSSFVNIAPAVLNISVFQMIFFSIQTLDEDIFPHCFDIAKFIKY